MEYKIGETVKGFKILAKIEQMLLVECKCGNVLNIRVGNFPRRKSEDCGCVEKEKLKNEKYGMLTLLYETEERYFNNVVWRVRCDCGTEKNIPLSRIKVGDVKSCGCSTHEMGITSKGLDGRTKTRLYRIWCGIKSRCYNPNSPEYDRYGGAGVRVCNRWLESFDNFKEDMEEGYSDEVSIDRIDPKGSYEPHNCRWASAVEQSYNQKMSYRNTSGCAGVWWIKKLKLWRVRIQKGGKILEESFVKDKTTAIKLRKEWEIKHYGYNKQ